MSYYCSEKNKDCYFGLDNGLKKRDSKDQGPHTTLKKCVEDKKNACKPYTCKGNTCVSDDDGIYHSRDACDVMCGVDDKGTFCGNLQTYVFSYLDFDLNCKDKSQQNLNIVFLIVIIWIGILLF